MQPHLLRRVHQHVACKVRALTLPPGFPAVLELVSWMEVMQALRFWNAVYQHCCVEMTIVPLCA